MWVSDKGNALILCFCMEGGGADCWLVMMEVWRLCMVEIHTMTGTMQWIYPEFYDTQPYDIRLGVRHFHLIYLTDSLIPQQRSKVLWHLISLITSVSQEPRQRKELSTFPAYIRLESCLWPLVSATELKDNVKDEAISLGTAMEKATWNSCCLQACNRNKLWTRWH